MNKTDIYEYGKDPQAYEKFRRSVDVDRAAFFVKTDRSADEYSLYIFLGCVVMASVIAMTVIKGGVLFYALIAAADAVAVGAAVAVAAYFARKKKRGYTAYFFMDGEREICIAKNGSREIAFVGDRAYVKEGERVYSLDRAGFCDWLDGECTSLVSLRAAEEKDLIYDIDINAFVLTAKNGGEHVLYLDAEGKILRIESKQPTRVADGSGRVSTKISTFIKTPIDGDFDVKIPDWAA